MKKNSLIEFPCHFPVKIIGVNTQAFIEEIEHITLSHFLNFDKTCITHKKSKGENYVAMTVTVYAENQEKLDAFYQEVTKHPLVKMVL